MCKLRTWSLSFYVLADLTECLQVPIVINHRFASSSYSSSFLDLSNIPLCICSDVFSYVFLKGFHFYLFVFACAYINASCVCPRRSDENIRSFETIVTDICELQCGC